MDIHMTYAMPVAAVENDMPLRDYIPWLQALTRVHGTNLLFRKHGNYTYAYLPGEFCWCVRCDDFEHEARFRLTEDFWPDRIFIVCPDCGNKRCPQAEWHEYECSGSNRTGQKPRIKGISDALDEIRKGRE